MNKGFVSLTILAIIGAITFLSAGGTYGVYKYQQVSKENSALKEQVDIQKDNQIQQLREQLESVTTQDMEKQSTSTVEENEALKAEEKRVADEAVQVAKQKAANEAYRVQQINDQEIAAQQAEIQRVADEAARVAAAEVQRKADEEAQTLLLVEKCKSDRDIHRSELWPVMLEAVDDAEYEAEMQKLDLLMEQIPLGSMPATEVFALAKTSDSEHQKNLDLAESQTEARLAEEYQKCIGGS